MNKVGVCRASTKLQDEKKVEKKGISNFVSYRWEERRAF